jgi:MauM/NapG family ferredoxin protein
LLLWLDPLAVFAGVLHPGGPNVGLGAWVPALVFLALLLLSLLWANAWCGRVCPLGAFLDLLYSWTRYFRTRLPSQRSCDIKPTTGWTLSRRTVLGIAAGAVCAGLTRRWRAAASRPLRPPGALDERKFSGVCTRCGNCLQVCPSRIIERDLGQNGLASLLTPVLNFRHDYCREDCALCTKVCPSGALQRIAPEDKMDVPMGLAKVDMDICILRDDRECTACRRQCPYDAIRYVFDESDYMTRPEIDAAKCPGCGACEAACPTTPKKAIVVLPV